MRKFAVSDGAMGLMVNGHHYIAVRRVGSQWMIALASGALESMARRDSERDTFRPSGWVDGKPSEQWVPAPEAVEVEVGMEIAEWREAHCPDAPLPVYGVVVSFERIPAEPGRNWPEEGYLTYRKPDGAVTAYYMSTFRRASDGAPLKMPTVPSGDSR